MIARTEQAPQLIPVSDRAGVAQRPPYDPVLLGAVLALVTLGIVMVYSSSAVLARVVEHKDSAYYLKRQATFAVAGLAAMALAMRVGYRRLQSLAYPILFLCGALVFAVCIPGLGVTAGHAQRWLRLPGFQLQPSEFAKIALCIYLARSVADKGDALKDFKLGFLPHCLVVGLLGAMVLLQKDFGAMVVMVVLMLTVLFVAGARMTYVFVAFGFAVPIAYGLIVLTPYRMARIEAFMHPFEKGGIGKNWQVAQALTSVGSGGIFGLGLGEGREKLGFLPAGHTDYILASIGEELGLVGIAITLLLFAIIIWRGLSAAFHAADPFGSYLAFAITALFATETAINAGMCLALLPSKGLALPFLSYGGSALLKAMIAAGILLSVSGGKGGYLKPAAGASRRV